jgi:hypothetical protein
MVLRLSVAAPFGDWRSYLSTLNDL